MAMEAIHESQLKVIPERVFFSGTTAIERGMGLCYNPIYGTATDPAGLRGKVVAVPTSANCMWFAGVSAGTYAANPHGQWIVIHKPGSFTQIAVGADTTINSGILTFSKLSADAGRFSFAGFQGKGSARILETDADGRLFSLLTGAATVNSTTLTVSSGLTAAAVAAGDRAILVAGTTGVTIGEYAVASVTSDTALVLATAPSASSLNCAIYIIRGNPVVQAYLMDGPESGGQTWLSPIAGTAVDCEEWGFTRVFGGITLATASTATLADGTEIGQRVGFLGMGTLTTAGYAITCTTALKQDDATDLNTLTIDAAAEIALLEWMSDQWKTVHSVGATLA